MSLLPRAHQMPRPASVERPQCAGAPEDLAGERRFLLREPAGENDGCGVLVDGIGFAVLVEERGRLDRVVAEPSKAAGVAAVRKRRGHLKEREVADDRS